MPTRTWSDRLDSTLPWLLDPYRFIGRRCDHYRSDIFATRLLGKAAYCLRGREAAELFYRPELFRRAGAAPLRLRRTLFGEGAVQGLDGHEHRQRKAMFMALMGSERIGLLAALLEEQLHRAARQWREQPCVRLYPAFQAVLMRAACDWAGVPLPAQREREQCRMIVALFDGAGAIGPRHWQARLARAQANRWMEEWVLESRRHEAFAAADTALFRFARQRGSGDAPLAPAVAAVEVLNVVRPIVAVAVYLTFVVHALQAHPECRRRLAAGEPGYDEAFVQEVRRFYPFFPAVLAQVCDDFSWRGVALTRHSRALLDLYGTNHDPRSWDAPDRFRPERFLGRPEHAYDFIPQGGGNPFQHHRCPGERIAIELMKVALRFFTVTLRFEVPEQDLAIDFRRLPALPRDRLCIRRVMSAA